MKVAGNSAASGTNSSAQPTGGSPSPSSSPPLSVPTLGPQVIPRRHAPAEALARQGSFRGFPALSQKTSPFKRQLSLRMNELPSTMQRKSDFPIKNTGESGILTSCPCPPLTAYLTLKYNSLIFERMHPLVTLIVVFLLIFLWCSTSSPRGRRRKRQHQFVMHSNHDSIQCTPRGPLLLSPDA